MNQAAITLGAFQQAFAAALYEGVGPASPTNPTSPIAALMRQPAFAVYRNTVQKACIDALAANYPVVARLVGDEWFRAAAAVHAAGTAPDSGQLVRYGSDFAHFLAAFEPARSLTYLPDVARLDRFWTEAHIACDARVLDAAALAQLTPAQVGAQVLSPHPAARWAWFDDAPIYAVWQRNRDKLEDASDIPWQADGALLTRPHDSVCWCAISHAEATFLDACARGQTLASAAAEALSIQPDANLAQLLAKLLNAGAFSAPTNPL